MSKMAELEAAFDQWYRKQGFVGCPSDWVREAFLAGAASATDQDAEWHKSNSDMLEWVLDHCFVHGDGRGQTMVVYLPEHEDLKCAIREAMEDSSRRPLTKIDWAFLQAFHDTLASSARTKGQMPVKAKETVKDGVLEASLAITTQMVDCIDDTDFDHKCVKVRSIIAKHCVGKEEWHRIGGELEDAVKGNGYMPQEAYIAEKKKADDMRVQLLKALQESEDNRRLVVALAEKRDDLAALVKKLNSLPTKMLELINSIDQ